MQRVRDGRNKNKKHNKSIKVFFSRLRNTIHNFTSSQSLFAQKSNIYSINENEINFPSRIKVWALFTQCDKVWCLILFTSIEQLLILTYSKLRGGPCPSSRPSKMHLLLFAVLFFATLITRGDSSCCCGCCCPCCCVKPIIIKLPPPPCKICPCCCKFRF